MGLLDGLLNRIFKTGAGSTARGDDESVLTKSRAAIRYVGATVTDYPEYNRTDVEFPSLSDAFDAQASAIEIGTEGTGGTIDIGTRSGCQMVIGGNSAVLQIIADQDTFFTFEALDLACEQTCATSCADWSLNASTSMSVVATEACSFVADTFNVSAQSGVVIASAASPPVAATDTVKIKADVAVLINDVTANYRRVSKGNGTTLQAGWTNELTGSSWTLPALSGVADGEVVKVVHSLSSGTISRAGSDVINAGSGHASDTTFTLSDQQSVITFRRVNSVWRVSFERSANASGGGGGSSITDGVGTLGIASSGDLTTSGVDNISLLGATGFAISRTDGRAVISGGGSELDLYHETGPILLTAEDGNAALALASDGSGAFDVAGTFAIRSRGLTLDYQTRPTTDVPAAATFIRPQRATSFATPTTANKIGGPLDIEAGEPRTPGTDQPGPINFYIGKGVSSSVDNGTIWHSGTRASVDYKLGHIRDQAGIWSLDGYRPMRVATLTTGHLLSLIGSGGISISDPNGYNIQAYSAGGIAAVGGGTINVYGLTVALFGFGSTRFAEWYYASSGTPFRRDWFFAAVTPAGSGATSIGSFAVPASSAGRFVGALVVRNGSANSKSWDVTFDWNADGSTVVLRNFSAAATTAQGTINATVAKGTESGLTCPIEVSSATGERCNLSGMAWING